MQKPSKVSIQGFGGDLQCSSHDKNYSGNLCKSFHWRLPLEFFKLCTKKQRRNNKNIIENISSNTTL
jgi:hypothetical protein